jgi:Ca2+-binding RTX toxin-like protein
VTSITGGTGADVQTFTGTLTNVTINGGTGADNFTLGAGNDSVTFTGFDAGATINGGTGTDTITVSSTTNAAVVRGDAGADSIVGGSGGDSITGGDGGDTMTGGAGSDVYIYTAPTQSAGANVDTITDFSTSTGDALQISHTITGTTFIASDAGAVASLGDAGGNLTSAVGQMVFITGTSQLAIDMDGNGTISGSDYRIGLTSLTAVPTTGVNFNITGSAGADTITTLGGKDTITSSGGADVINSGGGDDSISISASAQIDAGAGTDTLTVTTADSTVTTSGTGTFLVEAVVLTGDGIDLTVDRLLTTSITSVTGTAAGVMEYLKVTSAAAGTTNLSGITFTNAAASITGNAGADVITGGAAADVITPGAAADTITTGGGADQIDFTAYGDSATTAAPTTTFDTITSALNIQDGTAGVLKFKAPGGATTGTAVAAAANATAFTDAAGWLTLVNGVFNGGTLNGVTYGLTLITFSGGTGDGAAFNGVYALVNGATGAANFASADGDYIVKLTGTLTGTLNTAFFDFVA